MNKVEIDLDNLQEFIDYYGEEVFDEAKRAYSVELEQILLTLNKEKQPCGNIKTA